MHFSERDFYDNSLKKPHEKQKNNKRTTYKKTQFLAPWSLLFWIGVATISQFDHKRHSVAMIIML